MKQPYRPNSHKLTTSAMLLVSFAVSVNSLTACQMLDPNTGQASVGMGHVQELVFKAQERPDMATRKRVPTTSVVAKGVVASSFDFIWTAEFQLDENQTCSAAYQANISAAFKPNVTNKLNYILNIKQVLEGEEGTAENEVIYFDSILQLEEKLTELGADLSTLEYFPADNTQPVSRELLTVNVLKGNSESNWGVLTLKTSNSSGAIIKHPGAKSQAQDGEGSGTTRNNNYAVDSAATPTHNLIKQAIVDMAENQDMVDFLSFVPEPQKPATIEELEAAAGSMTTLVPTSVKEAVMATELDLGVDLETSTGLKGITQ